MYLGRFVAPCVLTVMLNTWAAASDPENDVQPLKKALLDYYESKRVLPTKEYLDELKRQGDVFSAACALLEEETSNYHENGEGRLFIYALDVLRVLRDDPRALPLFRSFLKLSPHDPRHNTAVIVILLSKDPLGEKLLRAALLKPGEDGVRKSSILSLIYGFGGTHWLDFLRKIELTPDEKADGLEQSLKTAIASLEKDTRHNESGGKPPLPGQTGRSTQSGEDSAAPPVSPPPAPFGLSPAGRASELGNDPEQKESSTPDSPVSPRGVWLRPAIAAILVCVLAVSGAVFILRRRQGRK